MPLVGDFYESYRVNEFVLVVDATVSPGVTKISGLSEGELDTIEQPDGGTHHVYKISGTKVKYEPLTIERYVDGSPEDKRFKDWFQATFNLTDPSKPAGSAVRKNGSVVKMHQGKEVLRFTFLNAWVKSSKFTDLEAGSTNALKQTIVLEHEGLQREN
jgi:phage tail-like protein